MDIKVDDLVTLTRIFVATKDIVFHKHILLKVK